MCDMQLYTSLRLLVSAATREYDHGLKHGMQAGRDPHPHAHKYIVILVGPHFRGDIPKPQSYSSVYMVL